MLVVVGVCSLVKASGVNVDGMAAIFLANWKLSGLGRSQ